MKIMNQRLVRLARRLDFVWTALSKVVRTVPTRAAMSKVDSILVIDLHLIGDMVMLLPLLEALRTRFPEARISLLAGPWSKAALAGSANLDDVIEYTAPWVKPQRFWSAILGYLSVARLLASTPRDLGIDVRGDVRQILLLWLAGCKRRVGFDFTGGAPLLTDIVFDDGVLRHLLDHHQRIAAHLGAWRGEEFTPSLTLTTEEKETARSIAPFIGFHFGASLPLRRLPTKEAAALITFNDRPDKHLVMFSASDMEAYTAEVLALLPSSTVARLEIWHGDLRGFIVKTSRATRMFTMDSGPAHISAALARDTVVFFGPNLPRYTSPRGRSVRIVESTTILCRPCDQRHCINPVFQACMHGLVDRWRLEGSALQQAASSREQC
jgi:ADP-heptose:LPS heptosyltransferase